MADTLHLLLDVQDHDVHADQLRHRRVTMPERAALTANEQAIATLDRDRAVTADAFGDLERRQKRLEDEIASVSAKQAAESNRMYSGNVTSPRELQAMQEDIDSLGRRQRVLEDELLEVMEQSEPVQAELDGFDERRAVLLAEAEALRVRIAEAEATLDAELEGVLAERTAMAVDLPADLLATYERLRPKLGGVAVARLEGAQCLGCHLSLPATELDAIRHAAPGTVVTHEECGRILVR